jgi:hypothetical protein
MSAPTSSSKFDMGSTSNLSYEVLTASGLSNISA